MQTASSGCNRIVTIIIIDSTIRSVAKHGQHSKKGFSTKYFAAYGLCSYSNVVKTQINLSQAGEAMSNSSPEWNKAIVLEAFDTLFNKRDYAAAERFWSPNYIQHSAHI